MHIKKMDSNRLKDALTGAELDSKGGIKEMAERLEAHYRASFTAANLIKCNDCNGVSDSSLDVCPYCGASDADSETEVKKEKGDTKMETNAVATGDKKAHEGKIVKVKKADIIPDGVTVEGLDRAVIDVQRLKGAAGQAMYDLGLKIKEIFDSQMWKARQEEGKSKYRSFNQFCDEELNFSHTQAFKIMDVCKAFTRVDVERFGTSKLGLLLEAPPEAREKLMESVKEGASKRQLEKKVKEEKAKAEKTAKAEGKAVPEKRDTGRKAMPKGVQKAKEQTITVASIVGQKKSVKLYAKPKKVGDKALPAKSIKDQPFGRTELANGVLVYFAVVEDSEGFWKLNLEFKRPEAKADPASAPKEKPAKK